MTLSSLRYLLLIFYLFVSGCSTTSSEVPASSINTHVFLDKNCNQLFSQLRRLENELQDSAYEVDKKKHVQDTKLAFGWLFWPSYFVIDDNQIEADKLSKIKGQLLSVSEVIQLKSCNAEV